MRSTLIMLGCGPLAACGVTPDSSPPAGTSSARLEDGSFEIVVVQHSPLPTDGVVAAIPITAPLEEEAARLCPGGFAVLDVSPVSLDSAPSGDGLRTSDTARVRCLGDP